MDGFGLAWFGFLMKWWFDGAIMRISLMNDAWDALLYDTLPISQGRYDTVTDGGAACNP